MLGMGTSWALSPSFVQAALFAGVRYIDTSETYENTVAEKVLGEVLERTKMRKDVYLVTKNAGYRKGRARAPPKIFESTSTPASSGSRPTTSTATTSTASPATRSRCSATRASRRRSRR